MKSRFTTIDLRAVLSELGPKLLGLRVINVYDVNNKTYLIRLGGTDKKVVLLFESGTRIHTTLFDWPKSQMPSNFAMKLRKHLKSRRLVEIKQLGVDRVVDMQFGSDEAAYHIICELYDRGNIALTDHEYTIMTLLRTRKDSEDVRFAVRETYPIETARTPEAIPPVERIQEILAAAKPGDNLRKLLNPHFIYGPALIEHCLLSQSFPANVRGNNGFNIEQDMERVMAALADGEQYVEKSGAECKGYIIQKREKKPAAADGDPEAELLTSRYTEFHPFLFQQHTSQPYLEFDSFDQAVDEFFSKMESQKLDMKVLHQEKEALKKLDNVKKDHVKRISSLQKNQELNEKKGALIEINLPLVEQALRVVRSAVANQIDWKEIDSILKEAQTQGDPVALAIKGLRLDTNHFMMLLKDPYMHHNDDFDDDDGEERSQPMVVEIDLALSAYANARRYFVQKKTSQKKEQRTMESSGKAIKSAEKKTMQALKDVATVASINKSRKTYWFEKFFWCVSTENYIIIAGRDQQQNEFVVKKYLSAGDIYVHADIHGASSVIIKNPKGGPVPPKTLQEAGTMAVCYSVAWEAKVITSAWWVRHDQVSKTAPTGEYLTTGSFMIRGKKNYLPPTQLVMGFGLLMKIDESCVWRHKDERRVRETEEEDLSSVADTIETDIAVEDIEEEGEDEEETGEEDQVKEEEKEDGDTEELKTEVAAQDEDDNDKGRASIKEEEDDDEEEEPGKEDDDKENAYPDTTIALPHMQRDRFDGQRPRGASTLSSGSYMSGEGDLDEEGKAVIYLGDDTPIILGGPRPQQPQKSKPRMSAKQRRDLKKQKKRPEGWTEDQVTKDKGDSDDNENEQGTEERIGEAVESDGEEEERTGDQTEEGTSSQRRESQSSTTSQQAPPKRGQKHKLKKMKQKYKDQDEEERRLRMEILASAGASKEVKGKKGRKAKRQEEQTQRTQHKLKQAKQNQHQAQKQAQNQSQQSTKQHGSANQAVGSGKRQGMVVRSSSWAAEGGKGQGSEVAEDAPTAQEAGEGEEVRAEDMVHKAEAAEQPAEDSAIQPVVKTHAWEAKKRRGATKEDQAQDESDDEVDAAEVNSRLMEESVSVLDTLTGCPHAEDLLLFAIPVCAPYNIMHNYKFKIKLTPGTSKKGKAAKTALNMFQHSKETTPREKDLFKGIKDVDLSRNIPGKVKLSAPNLNQKKKKK